MIIAYVGIALGFVTTILLFPNILTADQYGLTRVLLSVALICAQFSHLGMNNIVIRFFPYYQSSLESRKRLLSLTFLVPLVGFILFLILFFLFQNTLVEYYSERSELITEFYLYLIPMVFAILFFEVLNSYVRAMKDSVTGSFVNEIVVRVLLIILLVLHYYEWFAFNEFILIFVGIYAIQPFLMIAYLFMQNHLHFSLPFQNETRRLFKGMSIYGAYSVLGGLATLLVGNIDILMLSSMADLSSAAIYAVAFYVGSVIGVPQRSITKIASPVLADMLKKKSYTAIDNLYKRTALNQLIAGSLIYVGIWANLHNLIDILPAEYSNIYWVVVIIGLAKLFNMATGVNGTIIINSRHYRFDLYTNILLVILTITTNYLLIPVYGIEGAAIATAISIFIYNFVKFVFVWIKFNMQPFQWSAAIVLLIAAICLGISEQIAYMGNFYIDLIVRSAIIAAIFTGTVLFLKLSDDVQNLVDESIRRIKKIVSNN